MKCPFCAHDRTQVVDSRTTKSGKAIRRRRLCAKCKERFTTYEEVEIMRLTVIKRSGVKEEYNRDKIAAGIRKALEKRPISEERIQKLLGDVEYDIRARESNKIESREIGRIVLQKLKEVDDVGYIRFASVYKSFGSAESFKKEATKISDT